MKPVWISKELALAIHERQLAEHGGMSGIRDAGLLESALGRAQNLFAYSETPPTLAQLAAAYGFGISRNHPFLDGNKRTTFVAAYLFLKLNGITMLIDQPTEYRTFLALSQGELSEQQLADWLVTKMAG
ncbi:MAG: type II toxin-antitoxin system death-on-curing family toxin [Rickettsiales bacterium]